MAITQDPGPGGRVYPVRKWSKSLRDAEWGKENGSQVEQCRVWQLSRWSLRLNLLQRVNLSFPSSHNRSGRVRPWEKIVILDGETLITPRWGEKHSNLAEGLSYKDSTLSHRQVAGRMNEQQMGLLASLGKEWCP